jgi:hypothetical protein
VVCSRNQRGPKVKDDTTHRLHLPEHHQAVADAFLPGKIQTGQKRQIRGGAEAQRHGRLLLPFPASMSPSSAGVSGTSSSTPSQERTWNATNTAGTCGVSVSCTCADRFIGFILGDPLMPLWDWTLQCVTAQREILGDETLQTSPLTASSQRAASVQRCIFPYSRPCPCRTNWQNTLLLCGRGPCLPGVLD